MYKIDDRRYIRDVWPNFAAGALERRGTQHDDWTDAVSLCRHHVQPSRHSRGRSNGDLGKFIA